MAGRVDAQGIRPGAEAGAGLESIERCGVGKQSGPDVQRHALDHAVHNGRALEQIGPGAGSEKFVALNRTGRLATLCGAIVVDPELSLGRVLGRQEFRDDDSCRASDDDQDHDEPLIAPEGGEVASPRDAGFIDVRGAPSRRPALSWEGREVRILAAFRGKVRRDVVAGHSVPTLQG